MAEKRTLTRGQARRLILSHQGLWPPYELGGKDGILQFISRVGCIQFDPVDVVGRSPDLVLQARVSGFRPAMLEELLYKERRLLDGWDKMMSIYLVEDWPFFQRVRDEARRKYGGESQPIASILPRIRDAISEQGPISSLDLECDQAIEWPWGPTRLSRAALESMYWWGELVIHHRVRARRAYDFANRHIPDRLLSAKDPNETEEQYRDWRILRRIGGIGLLWGKSGDAWLGIPQVKSEERNASLKRLLDRGEIIEFCVEGISSSFYMRSKDEAELARALNPEEPLPRATLIAPLDNLLWDRNLVKALFDFEYRWEIYKPSSERLYGYYVLPVLYGDRFVARFEPGREKRNGGLIIKNWWWEPVVTQSDQLRAAIIDCFARFLNYLGADRLEVAASVRDSESLEWLASAF